MGKKEEYHKEQQELEKKKEKEKELEREKELEERKKRESMSSGIGRDKLDSNTSDDGVMTRQTSRKGRLSRLESSDFYEEEDVFASYGGRPDVTKTNQRNRLFRQGTT